MITLSEACKLVKKSSGNGMIDDLGIVWIGDRECER